MSKKIPVGGGAYIEPDDGERNSRFHVAIVKVERIPNTRTGHCAKLACGHVVMMFGSVEAAGGRVLCTVCRDASAALG
jgi:hypothetical protein